MQHAEWKLKSEKIRFFFALTLFSCSFVTSLVIVFGTYALQVQIIVGVCLVSMVMASLRFLLGLKPPLIGLITELVKVLTAHKGVNTLK